MPKLADYTAGGELRPALKIYCIFRRKYSTRYHLCQASGKTAAVLTSAGMLITIQAGKTDLIFLIGMFGEALMVLFFLLHAIKAQKA